MKRTDILMMATSIFVIAGVAVAQAAPGGERAGTRGGDRPDFATLDVDGDGQITIQDLEAMRDARFAEFDIDGDGTVTLEEFQTQARNAADERSQAVFERLDADGDGTLTRDILEARGGRNMDRMIDRLDADNSGGVSEEEFAAAKERMGRHGQRGGGDRAQGPRGGDDSSDN